MHTINIVILYNFHNGIDNLLAGVGNTRVNIQLPALLHNPIRMLHRCAVRRQLADIGQDTGPERVEPGMELHASFVRLFNQKG
ncbi:hypothetical protein D3C81_1549670 [compost metagenome]